MRVVPLLFLGGCPYIFGPADLSNVDGGAGDADTDTDTDSDTDADADGDADTDTTTTDLAPSLLTVDLTVAAVKTTIVFTAADADDDFVGGHLEMRDGATVLDSWVIPGDLADWNPAGFSTAVYTFDLPCDGWAPDLSFVLTDFAGHESDPLAVPFKVGAPTVSAGVDTFDVLDFTTLPVTWCSTGEWLGTPGQDLDAFQFADPINGPLYITLDWDPLDKVDIDLLLYDDPGLAPQHVVTSDRTIGTDGHAEFLDDILGTLGVVNYLGVNTWEADAAAPDPDGPWNYQVIVQAAP